jgi:polyhydroxybutyrate depolymerase
VPHCITADPGGNRGLDRRKFDAVTWQRAALCLALAACGDVPGISGDAGGDAHLGDGGGELTCGLRTGQRGKTSRAVHAAGLDRTYLVYLPPAADPRTPLPLVYVHHGYTMSGQTMFDVTGFPALADAHGIAVAFPDGQGGPDSLAAPWNVGTGVCPATGGGDPPNASGDDFALLDAIRADVELDQCIDADHVFVTGFSMGGYFSHHAGCMRGDLAGVAPHSGGTHGLDTCTSPPKPILIFHGGSDTIVPARCDDPGAPPRLNTSPSAPLWAARNGCATTTTTVAVEGGTCAYYDGCPAGAQVALCIYPAMGHCWAGGPTGSIYACPSYASATQLQWDFFQQHAW